MTSLSLTTTVPLALLVGTAVACTLPGRARLPVDLSADLSAGVRAGPAGGPVGTDRRLVRLLVALGCAAGAWVLVGGRAGPVVALVSGVVVARVLSRVEPAAVVRRRAELERDLPAAVDLLAACLVAGAAPSSSLATVGRAVGGAVADELALLGHRLDLGADPAAVWAEVARHPQLGPLGTALGRAHESGASVTDAVQQLSVDLREDAHARVEERARALEVKVAAPLGLCLLPAFVVLGIVPLVAGIVGSLSLR